MMGRTQAILITALLVLVGVFVRGQGLSDGFGREGGTIPPEGEAGPVQGPHPAEGLSIVDAVDRPAVPLPIPELPVGPDLDRARLEDTTRSDRMVPLRGTGERIGYTDAFMASQVEASRASDLEKEQDYRDLANGSVVEYPTEVLVGTLTYDPLGENDDRRDWYKIRLPDVSSFPDTLNGLNRIKFHLLSFSNGTGGPGGLYEYNELQTTPPTLESDYADFMDVSVLYYDPWLGLTNMGGNSFFYDDMDDADGWSHRGYWYYNCTSPVPSTGPEDADGFENGLTEVGWYYFCITLDFLFNVGVTRRDPFTVSYELSVDVAERGDTDEGSNLRENALENHPSGDTRTISNTDHVDWYRFSGSDMDRLWNQTFIVNRTWGIGERIGDVIYDTWTYFFLTWAVPGDDGVYGTTDDSTRYVYWVVSFFLSGGGFINDAEEPVGIIVLNNWTEAPDRSIYVGMYVEPATIYVSGQTIIGFGFPAWSTFSNHTLDYTIREEVLNRRPVVDSISVSSSNRFYTTKGDLSDTFTFEVSYSDADNDPPSKLDLFVGPKVDVWETFSLLESEKNPSDTDFTDGKLYSIQIEGSDLGAFPVHQVIMVNATDLVQVWSLRGPLGSANRFLNDTLMVFDDQPVQLNSLFEGIEPLSEDSGTSVVYLEEWTGNGPFDDPEKDFRGFYLWDDHMERWVTDLTVGPIDANISFVGGQGWLLELATLENAHGTVTLRVLAYDDHSYIETPVQIDVVSMNDPPVFLTVVAGGRTFSVDEVLPQSFKLDLRGKIDVLEDSLVTIRLVGEDTDPEEDRTPLAFSYLPSRSDNWDRDPDLDPVSGTFTMTPTNADVLRESSKLVFRVDDGSDASELEVLLDVKNINDPPVLSVGETTVDADQGERVRVQPTVSDVDPGEVHVYTVNMEEPIGTEHVDILSQMPHYSPIKGVDWDFDERTGELWFETISDDIWRDPTALLMERTVHIVIEVKDKSGASDSVTVTAELHKTDVWIPPTPAMNCIVPDMDPDTPGDQGLTVELSGGDYDTTLYPGWDYSWDLGDGTRSAGKRVNHTYLSEGSKRIIMRLVKESHSSIPMFLNITLELPPPPPEEPNGGSGNGSLVYIIIGAVALVVFLALVIAVLVLRKMRASVGEAGVPDRSGLPGPDYRQRVGTSPEKPKLRPAQDDHGESCPSCGATVRSGWFLCPSCKKPLQ